MNTTHRLIAAFAVALAGLGAFGPADAQTYPVRAVTVVVPFAAGGATDLLARVVAKSMEKYSGQPFIVENVGGAGATLGTAKVAASPPDGYKLLLGGASALVMAPHLYTGLKYDPFKSFEPIARIASAPYVVVVRADSKFQSYEELIDYAAKNPGKLNYGSPGEGSSLHLTVLLMLDGARVKATHIPYRGSAPAWAALLAGDVDFIIDTPSAALPMISGGKAKGLAVTGSKRIGDLAAVRTLNELGQKGFDSQAWFAMLAPAGTPAAVMSTLRKLADQVLRDPEVLAMLKANQFTPSTPEEAAGVSSDIRTEYDKWGSIIRAVGIQLK